MTTQTHQFGGQRGVALLMALFLTMVVALLLPPVLQRCVFQHNNAFRENRFITALHLAEAGIEEGIWHLSYDKQDAWTGWNISNADQYIKPTSALLDVEGEQIGEYTITIDDPIPLGTSINLGGLGGALPFPVTSKSEPTVTARAGVPDLESAGSEIREVVVKARARTIFSLGLFSDQDLELGGTTEVNSYDSRLGPYNETTNSGHNGDAGSNNNILLNGTPLIDGDAAAGGSIVLTGQNAEITGEVEGGMTKIELPAVNAYVEAAKLNNNNNEIPKAVKPNGQQSNAYNPATGFLDVAANCTLTLPGGTKENPKVYYLSGAKLNGNSKIVMDGYAIIYTDGNLDFSGGTVINNAGNGPPERLVVYSSGNINTGVKINGGAGFSGVVYAPDAQVTFSGGGNIFGAAVGGKVNMQGNAQFHYDEALGEVGLIAYFEVREWVEKASPNPSSG